MDSAQQPSQQRGSSGGGEPPTPLGRGAKRLARFAGNLLASAIVVAAGLTFGRQVLLWWNGASSPPPPPSLVAPLLGDEARPHLLEFGDYPFVLQREVLAGDRRAALDRLLARCSTFAEQGTSAEQAAGPAGPAELAMLRRIEGRPPVASGKGWKLYELERPLPLVAATAETPAPDGSGPRRRVVSWGLALPAAESGQADGLPAAIESWTLFAWSASAAVKTEPRPTPPLPKGARQTVRLSAEDGSALVAFRGGGAPRDAIDFYNDYFARTSPQEHQSHTSAWRETDGVWHARFAPTGGDTIDIQLAPGGDGVLSGVLTIVPPARDIEE
jgi:hypothetical protein